MVLISFIISNFKFSPSLFFKDLNQLLFGQLGSFLMGLFGVVFKPDLRNVSEHLTVGITTGYMGSLTTFSGWNQKMLLLSSKGHWMFAVAGMLLGMSNKNVCKI
jgi:fluoride ion exporter CrcB/FEX